MEFNDSTAWTKNSGSGHDAGRYNGKDRGDAVILAILLAWFALAVLSGIGACYALTLVLDGMRSAWALIIALMAAATLAVWMGADSLSQIWRF